MIFAELDEATGEFKQISIDVLPVVPGEIIVVAVGIVVSVLAAALFVARQQHGHPLRKQQRGQEVSLLLCAQLFTSGSSVVALPRHSSSDRL